MDSFRPRSRRTVSSDRQTPFPGTVRERRDAPVIQAATPVEHRPLNPGFVCAVRQQGPHGLRAVGLVAGVVADITVRRGGERPSVRVIDELRVDVPVRPVDRETRSLCASPHVLAHAYMAPETSPPLRRRFHHAAPFAAFPAFFLTYS